MTGGFNCDRSSTKSGGSFRALTFLDPAAVKHGVVEEYRSVSGTYLTGVLEDAISEQLGFFDN